jgi:hypothetical protein
MEQQAGNKFCFKVRKTVIETVKDVKLFVEMKLCLVCMSSGGCKFSEQHEDFEGNPRSGWPPTAENP